MPSLTLQQYTDAQLEQLAELHARALAIEAVREAIDDLDIMRDRVGVVDIGHLWAAQDILRNALETVNAWTTAYEVYALEQLDRARFSMESSSPAALALFPRES